MDKTNVLIVILAALFGLASLWLVPLPAKVSGQFGYAAQQFFMVAAGAWLGLSIARFAMSGKRPD